jgi:hypothetical protein
MLTAGTLYFGGVTRVSAAASLKAAVGAIHSVITWGMVLIIGFYTVCWLFTHTVRILATYVLLHFGLTPFTMKNTTYVWFQLGLTCVWFLYGTVRSILVLMGMLKFFVLDFIVEVCRTEIFHQVFVTSVGTFILRLTFLK